ncbi:hypothetical protein GCM10027413_29910 [Conyzicola nivalis]|uniref:Uncharacterized protein n=1 Tax=Conyzicola nivalis TaxID=1477021 RepID=A0A916SR04_9MICO|nr:hypothetical protein [Conyzicola nivalis]GGB13252.1 hypothetical protein GCM10010979_29600 [Conyzicola nivalis]
MQSKDRHDLPATGSAKGVAIDLGIGAGAAFLGLLAWLVTGARLPLQNLWATGTLPDDMPLVLLPFSQYALGLIVSVIVAGSAIAGAVARVLRARKRPRGVPAIAAGAVIVYLVALVQTWVSVSAGLLPGTASVVYLAALVGGTVAAIVLGVVVLLLIARAPAPGLAVGVTIVAIVIGASMNGVVLPFGLSVIEPQELARGFAQWIPAIGVGVALAWSGFGTVGRALAAAGSLLLLWLGPAAFTAIAAAAGTRVLAGYPTEMAEFAGQVFVSLLGSPRESLVQVAIAIVTMLVALVAFRVIRNRRALDAAS